MKAPKFLELDEALASSFNGLSLDATDDELVDLVVGVAEGRVSKADLAVFFQRASR